MESKLIGYVRKSNSGEALRMSIDYEAFESAERYKTGDGREFVSLVASLDKIEEVMDGTREVTSLCQLVEG